MMSKKQTLNLRQAANNRYETFHWTFHIVTSDVKLLHTTE